MYQCCIAFHMLEALISVNNLYRRNPNLSVITSHTFQPAEASKHFSFHSRVDRVAMDNSGEIK